MPEHARVDRRETAASTLNQLKSPLNTMTGGAASCAASASMASSAGRLP
jgi:hypothetical protein